MYQKKLKLHLFQKKIIQTTPYDLLKSWTPNGSGFRWIILPFDVTKNATKSHKLVPCSKKRDPNTLNSISTSNIHLIVLNKLHSFGDGNWNGLLRRRNDEISTTSDYRAGGTSLPHGSTVAYHTDLPCRRVVQPRR